MTAHSKLSPSSSHRWMNCPGSVKASEDIEQTVSSYAKEGTAAHMLGEMCLSKDVEPHSHLGLVIIVEGEDFIVDEDMADAVKVYTDYVRERRTDNCHVDAELYLDMTRLHPDLGGTADYTLYFFDEKLLEIVDYKHGAGIAVEVPDNPQLLNYAIGAAIAKANRPLERIRITVVQPRKPHPDGVIRSWEIDVMDLLEWSADLRVAARATEADDAFLLPGDWCRWCPAAAICPLLAEKAQESARDDFKEEMYDPNELAETLTRLPLIENWIKSVREFAYNEAEHGRCPPGFKLVAKTARRKWIDEEDIRGALDVMGYDAEEIETRKLKSPAQIEKLIGKDERVVIADLISSTSSGHNLAPESDKRPPVKPEAKDEFATA